MNGTPLEFSWPERSEIEEALILERALGIGPFEVLVCQDLNAEPGRRNDDTDPPTLVLHDGRWESPGGYALGAPFETIPDPGDLPRERMERVMAALGVDGKSMPISWSGPGSTAVRPSRRRRCSRSSWTACWSICAVSRR